VLTPHSSGFCREANAAWRADRGGSKGRLCRATPAGNFIRHQDLGSTVPVRGTVVLVAAHAANLLLPLGAAGLFRKPPKAKNPGMKAGARDSRSVHPAATIIRD